MSANNDSCYDSSLYILVEKKFRPQKISQKSIDFIKEYCCCNTLGAP